MIQIIQYQFNNSSLNMSSTYLSNPLNKQIQQINGKNIELNIKLQNNDHTPNDKIAIEQTVEKDKKKKKNKHRSESQTDSDDSRKKHKKHKKHKKQKKHGSPERSRSSQRSRRKRKQRSRSRKRHHRQSPRKQRKSRQRQRDRNRERERERSKYRQKSKQKIQIKDKQKQLTSEKKSEQQPPQMPQIPQMPPPPKQVLPLQIPMPLPMLSVAPNQRRKRQRSRSPRDYYKKNMNGNDGQFWDSFSWQPKLNLLPNVSSTAYINTKKMRRVQITNIPIEMGLTENDINDLVTKFMIKNYLNDPMNNCPIVNIQISEADRSVAIELSSVEETCRLCKLQKIQLMQGSYSRIIRLGDSIYGASIVSQAQTAAQAMAAAFGAINIFQNKTTNFSVNAGMTSIQSSSVLRITNAVTPYMCEKMPEQQWKEYYEDLIDGFSLYGKIKHNWFVRPSRKTVGAEAGNLFVQYETKEQAEKAMRDMQDRKYDQRNIRIFFIPEEIYEKHYKPLAIN